MKFQKRSNNRGFGIVEVLVASAIMAVIAMGVGTVIVNMQKGAKSVQQSADAADLIQAINVILSDSAGAGCAKNFGTPSANPKPLSAPNAVNQLTDDLVSQTGALAFDVNSTTAYGNGQFFIQSYAIVQDLVVSNGPPIEVLGRVVVAFLKKSPETSIGPSVLVRSLGLKATLTGGLGSNIATCQTLGLSSNNGNADLWKTSPDGVSVYNNNLQKVGIGTQNPIGQLDIVGGNGLYINQGTAPLQIKTVPGPQDTFVFGAPGFAGTIMSLNSVTGNVGVGGSLTSAGFCIGADCRTTFAAQSCPANSVPVTLNANGSVTCATLLSLLAASNIACPANSYLTGFSSTGPICQAMPTGGCPVNQYVSNIAPNGTVTCTPIPTSVVPSCPPGQYMTAINAGVPVCSAPAVANFTCPAGQYVSGFDSNGAPVCNIPPTTTTTMVVTATTVTTTTLGGPPGCISSGGIAGSSAGIVPCSQWSGPAFCYQSCIDAFMLNPLCNPVITDPVMCGAAYAGCTASPPMPPCCSGSYTVSGPNLVCM